MSRYRAPPPGSSPLITAVGHARLKAEFEQLWRQRRPEVVRALSAAAAEGDRSENAEYQYRKKELREIDARLRYLTTRLEQVQVVADTPADHSRIYFGAWVAVRDGQGVLRRWRIVGADEMDPRQGHISVDAPVARALLGRAAGEEVRVQLPGGDSVLVVEAVRYGSAPDDWE
jgi:transcription elongation factor GreB